MAEPQRVKYLHRYAPGYRVVAANAAWIAITPRNDVKIDFVVEKVTDPNEVVYLMTPEGSLGPEVARLPEEPTITRDCQIGVMLSLDAAEAIADFIKASVQRYRGTLTPKPGA